MRRSAVFAAMLSLTFPPLAYADGAREGGASAAGDWRQTWNWDPLILLSLGLLAWLYCRGLARMRTRSTGKKIRWRVAAHFAALLAIFLALISPLDAVSEELSSAHMVQHMLLTIVAAPLFVAGSPTLMLAWGLPEWRKGAASSLYTFIFRLPQAPILWRPAFLWALFAVTLWAWHLPVLYQAALRDPLVHDAQHLSFFVVACFFWRACIGQPSRRRLCPALAIPYLFATSLQSSALGIFLALSPRPWYDDYANRTGAWGLTPLQDQQLAGLIMWMPACLIYPAVAAILFGSWLRSLAETAERKTCSPLPAASR